MSVLLNIRSNYTVNCMPYSPILSYKSKCSMFNLLKNIGFTIRYMNIYVSLF